MRAVAVTEFGAAPRLMELPKPAPAPGEVLVRLVGASLNPFDRAVYEGFLGHLPHDFPLVVGVDGCGTVEARGEGAERFEQGEVVYGVFTHLPLGDGTLAEYVAVPESVLIGPAPSRVSPVEAAAAPTAGMTAIGLTRHAEVGAGQKVLIVGASGGVGTFVVQLAAARGAQVLATARSDAAEGLRALGAAETLDYGQRPVAEQVAESEPGGVDVLLDLISDPEPFAANMGLVRDGGWAVSIRYAAQPEALEPGRIRVANFSLREHPQAPAFLAALTEEIDSGGLKVVIDTEVALDDAPAAIAARQSGGVRGKTAIRI